MNTQDKLYPQACDVLGIRVDAGNTVPFDGSDSDWHHFRVACAQRDSLQAELSRLRAEREDLLGALREIERDATWNDEDTTASLKTRLDNLSESAFAVIQKAQEGSK